MQNLERQLNKETLHEKDSNSGLSMIKVQFDNFIHSRVLELSNYNSHALEITQDFKAYTNMEAQTFKETIIQNMDSSEQCIVERARHEQELQNRLKRLNERKLQIQECKIREVKASNACSRDTNSSGIVSDKGNDQSLENHSNTSRDESSRSKNECNDKSIFGDDTDIRPSYDTEPIVEVDSNVIPDSPNMCDNDIQNDQNAVECEDERVALANLIANLKLDISVVKEKHDELVKQSLLTKSHYEGLVKEKTKVITDLKLKEEKDIDKMISMENQLKFLNEIVYKRSQSIQTIHMLAPKCPTFNGRPTFANPKYLKKAQSEIPCLYEIPHDQSDPANRLVPDREETLTLERESRSKLNKDLVKPYDYTKLNSLYEIFKPPTQEYQIQLAHANEVRKKMWRKSFVKTKPNIFKNINFLPVSKSISKSRQAYNVMTNNINHLREIVDQAWVKHSKDHLNLRAPTAHDMQILIKTCLMPLALKTQNDSFAFVHELKQEMHADLKYVESLEKEVDELEYDKAEFSNMYDMLLQELKECECLAQKLSKQTEFVSKEVYNELLRSFAKLEKHSISLELALQQCQEQMKNDTVCKEKASNVFQKEREQYFEIQDLKAQLQDKNIAISELKKLIEKMKDKALNTKPIVQQSARLPNTANGNKPKPRNFNQQPRNWPPSMRSRVSNKIVNTLQPPRNQNPYLKSKYLACPTCKKCIYSANHDECILQYLSKVNSRTSAQKKDAQSHKTTKRYIPVEKKSESKNHGRQIPIRQRYSPNKSSNVYLKTTPLKSGLTWKPTGRTFNQVGLKWIPIKKPVETRYNTNDSASPLGKETHNPKTVICANSSLSAGTSMASEPISSQGLSNVQYLYCKTVLTEPRYKRRCCSLIPAESDSLPHAHAQTTKTYYKHQDSRIKKA
ncbi:hypothetical protein Tco_0326985 [Tanacetum coccineum]